MIAVILHPGVSAVMNVSKRYDPVVIVRLLTQWGFLAVVVSIGIRFGMFVRHFESGGTAPYVTRPPGVEGFLPIGALASLKQWFVSGDINPVHPAALVIFLTAVGMSLLAKKSFCSWLCPVGTISEGAGKLGIRLYGRNFRMWNWLDVALRSVKYLLLLFFVKIILIDMAADSLAEFLGAPYWAVSDVKMLRFLIHPSTTTIAIIGLLTALSLLYRNFWCRYLCPYGALLGVVSMMSPLKIRRDTSGCTGCRRCSAACPAGLRVHAQETVRSPECSGCLTCLARCPERDVLRISPPFWRRPIPPLIYAALVVLLFAAGLASGMVTGHWQSALTRADYQRLIPMAGFLEH